MTSQESLEQDILAMLAELKGLINDAADAGNLNELSKLTDKRDALTRILDHCPN